METGATIERSRPLVLGPVLGPVLGLVALVLLCWMLLVPQGGQPDEHSHLVRSAALIRDPALVDDDVGAHLLPDRYLMPDPGCYAFDPTRPASCALPIEPTGADVRLLTRADDYPPGAHAVFGLATLLPGPSPVWWGRLVASAIATVLVGAAIVAAGRSSRLEAGALLFGMTPMAWSILPAVNPSSLVTAGAVALWVGMLAARPYRPLPTDARWLVAAGWAAMSISRRDGLIWACLVVGIALVVRRVSIVTVGRELGRSGLAAVGASTLVAIGWSAVSSSSTSKLLVVAPLALTAVELLRARWRPDSLTPLTTGALAATGVVVAAVGWVIVVSTRAGGWDTNLVLRVVGQTDDNLVEAIGVLGWLDTPVPWPVTFGWLITLGGLAALGPIRFPRGAHAALAVAALAVVTSWTFELLQGNDSGTYWQGRYSLPLLVGIPLCLATRPSDEGAADRAAGPAVLAPIDARLARWTTLFGLGALDVAAWAAARRWGVGISGSYLPWRWDTAIQPIPPVLILIVLAGATAGLAAVVLRHPADQR